MYELNTGTNVLRIDDYDFIKLTEYLRANYGINLSKKRALIEGRLNNYIIQKGYSDYRGYLNMLFSDRSGQEMSNVINFLTTNYSYFLREWETMNYYREYILSDITNNIRDLDLRVWSAGCSTGEEPYTIAMLNNEFFESDVRKWDKRILATDISQKVLGKAREGVYSADSMDRVPPLWRMTYFDKLPGGSWQVKQKLKDEVIFRRFNLIDELFPFRKKFHVIFCRNVMIYFDARTRQQLIERFYQATEPGGYLIIGQSESIDRNDSGYKFILPSIYKKVVKST